MNLKRVFFSWILVTLLGIILVALFGPPPKPIDWKTPRFSTSQSSSLYFKNLRAYYYDNIAMDSSGMEFLRIRSRNDSPISDSLQLVIVRNWRLDEAYLLFEKRDGEAWIENFEISWTNEDKTGKIRTTGYGPEGHFALAAQLLYELDRNSEIFLNDAQNPMSERSKKSLKRSLKDYFKLLGIRN